MSRWTSLPTTQRDSYVGRCVTGGVAAGRWRGRQADGRSGDGRCTDADSVSSTTADGSIRRSRSGGSRRGLPTGRALVGGLLVTMAAVVVFAAYAGAQSRPSTSVVVARRDLDPGERLTAADVEVRAVDAARRRGRTAPSPTAGQLVGAVDARAHRRRVSSCRRGRCGSSRRGAPRAPEFSFPVDRERALAGDLQAGESVDLLATFGSGSDATHRGRRPGRPGPPRAGVPRTAPSARPVASCSPSAWTPRTRSSTWPTPPQVAVITRGPGRRREPDVTASTTWSSVPPDPGPRGSPRSGRWACSAALPVEFVRCVSADEVRARLAAGRLVVGGRHRRGLCRARP